MTKPPKTPRPIKPPIQRADPSDVGDPTIGLIQEKLIGRAVVEWAKLEACMGDAIGKLLNLEFQYTRLITARMEAVALLRLLRDVGELRLEESDFHKLSVICDKIDIRREDRNLIVHGSWGRTSAVGNGTIAIALSLRIKGDPNEVASESFSHTRMQAIIADIQSLKWDLIRLVKLGEPLGTRLEPPPAK
jgi:hypothetical protein